MHSKKKVAFGKLPIGSFDEIFVPQRLGSRIRFSARMILGRPWQTGLLQSIASSPAWKALYADKPIYFRPALRGYLDRRFGLTQRYKVMSADLSIAAQKFGIELSTQLSKGQHVSLADIPGGYSIHLGVNDLYPEEGMWMLSIKGSGDKRIFHMTFGFLAPDRMLIGSIQGPRRSDDLDPPVVIKDITKAALGLRPANMLVFAIQALAQALGCTRLMAIDPSHHVQSRWLRGHRDIRLDYQELWKESGAHQGKRNYWRIPSEPVRRPLEDIDSKKRSQYRKRYQMLDELAASLIGRLRPSFVPDATCM